MGYIAAARVAANNGLPELGGRENGMLRINTYTHKLTWKATRGRDEADAGIYLSDAEHA